MIVAKKIAKNFLISALGRISSFALALIIVGYISRYLGMAGFGEYSTILAFVYVFTVIADLGLYQVGLREISKVGSDEQRIVGAIFSLRFFWGIVIFSLAPVIGLLFPYPANIKAGVAIAVLGFWFLSNSQVLMSIFQKYLKTQYPALADIVGRVVQLSVVLYFISRQKGFYSIILAMVAGAAANFLIIFFSSRKFIKIKLKIDFKEWVGLIKVSFPLAIAGILTMIYFKLDVIFLSLLKEPADVGIYSLAYRVLESLIFFPLMFVGLVVPQMVKFISLNDPGSYKKITQKTLDILLIIAVPLVVGGAAFSREIVVLLGGDSFQAAAAPLIILLVATAIIFVGALASNILIVLNSQKHLGYIYGAGAIFNILTNLIFIPLYSYIGAAATTVATELLVTILMIYFIVKIQKYFFSFRITVKIVLATIIMAGFIYAGKLIGLHPALNIPLAAVIYCLAAYTLGVIVKSDINLLLAYGAQTENL